MAQISDITAYILDKYKAEANRIQLDAKLKYDEEIKSYTDSAQKQYDEIISNANSLAEMKVEMAHSTANQVKAKAVLKAKNKAVEDIFNGAMKKILAMNDKEYQDILISLLKKYHENKQGEIILSSADDKRDLSDLTKLASELGLEICKDKKDFPGGFILKYGSVEQNCSIDAIFKEKKEEITDYINSNLFK